MFDLQTHPPHLLTHVADPTPGATAAAQSTAQVSTAAAPDVLFEVKIPRDLCVQLVGSDAGKEKRIKPQSHMTKNATPEELAAVEEVMRPFLDAEIKRRHEDKSHRVMEFVAKVTPMQARAIKKFCLPYAVHLKQHLANHPGDDRYHRSEQRLDQIHFVVSQINAALGTPFDDGQTLEERVAEVDSTVRRLITQLEDLDDRTVVLGSTSPRVEVLVRLRDHLRSVTGR